MYRVFSEASGTTVAIVTGVTSAAIVLAMVVVICIWKPDATRIKTLTNGFV